MRHKLLLGTTAAALTFSSPASAVSGVLSGETQLLTSILVQELAQVASLADSVANLKNLVAGINDIMATGRSALRIAKAIATFDPKTLLDDMKTTVLAEFPEAYELYIEVKDLEGNIATAGDGEVFWNRYTQADYRLDDLAERTARFGIRSSALNLLGPIVDEIDPDDTDRLLERFHRESKTSLKRAIRQSAWSQFVRRLKRHDQDARQVGNLAAQINVVEASAGIETANNTAELLDLEKSRAAKAQAEREYQYHLPKAGRRRHPQGPRLKARIFKRRTVTPWISLRLCLVFSR